MNRRWLTSREGAWVASQALLLEMVLTTRGGQGVSSRSPMRIFGLCSGILYVFMWLGNLNDWIWGVFVCMCMNLSGVLQVGKVEAGRQADIFGSITLESKSAPSQMTLAGMRE
jgi:hypothetical protein